jgi:hypothetical protein
VNTSPEIYEQLVQELSDYICSLPDGSKLTLEDAVKAVRPEIFDELDLLDYSLLSDVEERVNQTDTWMDLSQHEGKFEGLPFSMDFFVRKRRKE